MRIMVLSRKENERFERKFSEVRSVVRSVGIVRSPESPDNFRVLLPYSLDVSRQQESFPDLFSCRRVGADMSFRSGAEGARQQT